MKINLDSYINLILDFLVGRISGDCFQSAYFKLFEEEEGEMSELEFPILNTLFLDADEFCSNPELIDEHDIDEKELKKRCKIALRKLKNIRLEAVNKKRKVLINLESYIQLINDLLWGNTSIECFKYIYIKTFTEEIGVINEEEYAVLDGILTVIILGDKIELMRHCSIAVKKLKMIKDNEMKKI